ncbi:hypothetical protein BGZ74_002930 [Mortierella antarctica]|nr:hypothetical protein BGZ74_002930 [Mortierella antarctica]
MTICSSTSITAGMTGVSTQGSKLDEMPVYTSDNSAANAKDPELQWYLEVFQNESGETFAQLFDILMRHNDMVEEHVHQQIRALPASGRERKAQLAIAMMELRLEQVWLQSQKETYLAYPDEREPIREGVLSKVMGIIKSRDMARKYFATKRLMEWAQNSQLGSEFDPEMLKFLLQIYQRDNHPTPLGEVRWQELEHEYAEDIRQREQQDAYWRAKAEEARRAAEGKLLDDEACRRKKYEEDAAKRQKKYEEDAATRRKQIEDNAAKWHKQMEEDSAKRQRELEDRQNMWLKRDAEEYARWQKKQAEDFARWEKQDAEYLAKWQKKDVELLAKQRIRITEDVAKSRAKEAQDRVKLRTNEATDRAESA